MNWKNFLIIMAPPRSYIARTRVTHVSTPGANRRPICTVSSSWPAVQAVSIDIILRNGIGNDR